MKKKNPKPLRLMRLMNEVDPKWMVQFTAYARHCREDRPLPDRTTLSVQEQAQYMIVADWLQAWLARNLNVFTSRSMSGMFARYQPVERLAVFTSNAPGLIAAREAFVPRPTTLITLLDTEYAEWMKLNPNDHLKSHWHFFCEFRPVHPLRFPIYHVEYDSNWLYWEQHSGAVYGSLYGIGEYVLWQWDGETASRASNTCLTWQS